MIPEGERTARRGADRDGLLHPRLREAARLIKIGQAAPAAGILRDYLKRHPRDGRALHLLAGIARSGGRLAHALELLARAVECAPDLLVARCDYAAALLEAHRPDAAFSQTEELLKRDGREPAYRALRARALEALDDYAGAADIWRRLLDDQPENIQYWTRYAWALRALGRSDETIAAYRKVIALQPGFGGVWWNLADLKTYRFSDAEIGRMDAAIATPGIPAEDRACLHFALGKAYADRGLYESSFGNYAKGNAIRRLSIAHDPDVLTAYVARAKRVFRPDVFESFADCGSDSREPIFVVGMMRSGSTLVEQILASHSQVEGTRELPEIAAISRHLQQRASQAADEYPGFLERIEADALRDLAARYLETARAHCRLGRPFFIDKMGANFAHVGLIRLLFPKSRIVDVRRHPLACGFSIFSQYFPEGQNNTFRLADIGRHYRDYVELMAHFDRVLPGAVHRIFYEDLVVDTEAGIRRLLGYLELPFEEACLDFHRTKRPVATVSAEQVRMPIYHAALERWRNYERWLGPLKSGLEPVLESYPLVPEFD
ncbi:MAG: sulfotransferase [Rhizomicrobium sp.]